MLPEQHGLLNKGGFIMGLAVIFGLVTILAAYASYRTLREKNLLGLLFAGGSTVVFGAFAIATVVGHFMGKVTVPLAH